MIFLEGGKRKKAENEGREEKKKKMEGASNQQWMIEHRAKECENGFNFFLPSYPFFYLQLFHLQNFEEMLKEKKWREGKGWKVVQFCVKCEKEVEEEAVNGLVKWERETQYPNVVSVRERVRSENLRYTYTFRSLPLSPSLSIQIFVERPSILVPCNPGCDLGAWKTRWV